jgi:hypothetical protein
MPPRHGGSVARNFNSWPRPGKLGDHDRAPRVNCMDLKNVLGEAETNLLGAPSDGTSMPLRGAVHPITLTPMIFAFGPLDKKRPEFLWQPQCNAALRRPKRDQAARCAERSM